MESIAKAHAIIDLNLKKHEASSEIRRRRRCIKFSELRHFSKEILDLSQRRKCTKRWLAKQIENHFKIKVSADQVYRFVKSMNGGLWPNRREKQGNSND